MEVVAGAFTIQRAEAVSSSLALLGFQRATKKAYGQVYAVVEQLIAGYRPGHQDGKCPTPYW
jgi:hypothetical protein